MAKIQTLTKFIYKNTKLQFFYSKVEVENLRPACGWEEVKPVLGFCDENREIRDRFKVLTFFSDHYVFVTKIEKLETDSKC